MNAPLPCDFCGSIIRKPNNGRRHFCNTQCKAQYQRLAKPVTKEWLETEYILNGKDCVQIAAIVNRDPKSVWNWLKDFGIPTRPRGSTANFNNLRGGPGPMTGRKHSDATRERIRQARMNDGHVPYLKNGVHHLKGKRGADTPNWKGGHTPERANFYGTQEWKNAVKAIWKRDDAKCQRCGLDSRAVPPKSRKFDIHHIVGFACVELRSDVDNLVLLCEDCHYFVHSRININKEYIK